MESSWSTSLPAEDAASDLSTATDPTDDDDSRNLTYSSPATDPDKASNPVSASA